MLKQIFFKDLYFSSHRQIEPSKNFSLAHKLIKQTFVVFTLFTTIFAIFGSLAGGTAVLRAVDGAVGVLHEPTSEARELVKSNWLKKLLSPVTVEAQFGDIFGGVFKALLDIAVQAISQALNQLLNIVRSLVSQLNEVLSFVDKFIEMLEKLAEFLSTTRIGLAFKVFESFQNDSNLQSSNDFAISLIEESKGTNPNLEVLDARGQAIVTDAVAWLDFINAQRALQADTLTDVLSQYIGINLDYYNEVRGNLQIVLSGNSCNTANLQRGLGPFAPILSDNTACQEERNARNRDLLSSRESDVRQLAVQRLRTFEEKAPQDCKSRSYIEYNGAGFSYQPGNLVNGILQVSRGVEVLTPTLEECEVARTGNREGREALSGHIQAANLTAASEDNNPASQLFQNLYNEIAKSFEDIFKEIKESITSRFGRVMDALNQINFNNTGLFFASLEISTSVAIQIQNQLNNLQQELRQKYQTQPNDAPNFDRVPDTLNEGVIT